MIKLKVLFVLLSSLWGATIWLCQNTKLKFNKDGKFKIVQYTDVHFKYGNPASDVALERINDSVGLPSIPYLVVFNGDVIYAAPADSGMH